MNLFDILGPVMVGPSSSHTAGAVRIGWMTQKLLGEQPVEAKILMYGSFAATGKGHGTDRGLVAGLLGMRPDDERIPDSFEIARKMGLSYSFGIANLTSAHPNSVVLEVKGKSGRTVLKDNIEAALFHRNVRHILAVNQNASGGCRHQPEN